MSISHAYRVHSVATEGRLVKAEYNGREIAATVPCLTVELLSEAHGHTFRLSPDVDADEARELFVVGAEVIATFTAGRSAQELAPADLAEAEADQSAEKSDAAPVEADPSAEKSAQVADEADPPA